MMSLLSSCTRGRSRHSMKALHLVVWNYREFHCNSCSSGQAMASASRHQSCFSTFATTKSVAAGDQARLAKTLYRQLLRWSKDTGDDIPLASFLPPVTITEPMVDQGALDKLRQGYSSDIRSMLPSNILIEDTMLTVPLRKASDFSNFLRAVFRMNAQEPSTADVVKSRVSMSFETVKSVNYLTTVLNEKRVRREAHIDRQGVNFSIGQVVQHKSERWRGVILSWDRKNKSKVPPGLTSLTTKDYSTDELPLEEATESDAPKIQYTIMLDAGDAHLLSGQSSRSSDVSTHNPVALQSELEPVNDLSLCRIRNKEIDVCFQRFDATSKCFVPKEQQQFEYPHDDAHVQRVDKETEDEAERERNALGSQMSTAIQSFASRLLQNIQDITSCAESRGLNLVVNVEHRLRRLKNGDVLTDEDVLTLDNIAGGLLGTLHLRWLKSIDMELSELLTSRHMAKEALKEKTIEYRLGDIVQHKEYGFRGVVIGWDPTPVVDVSRWDGVTNIDNPNEKPFYRVIPHQPDCIEAFGAQRSMRYVCQENLELTPRHRTLIDVDLEDPMWEKDNEAARYIPPLDLKFKHGEEVDEDGATEQCFNSLHGALNDLHIAQRGLPGIDDDEIKQIGADLAVEELLRFLKLANNMSAAATIQEIIKELWKTHTNADLRRKLDEGTIDLLQGNKEIALAKFRELLAEDPDYAEAWNKASTTYFMLGDMQSSLEAAEKALELVPCHFQAMSGLGLIQHETRRYKVAAGVFRKSLKLDPWSPVSSRLASCLDLLHGLDLEEEQGAAEGTAPYE